MVPNLLRDPDLRLKLRDFLRWYRALDGWAIAGEHPDREQTACAAPLGLLSVAMLDGLALQALTDPDLDVEPAFRLWKQLVVEHLDRPA